MSRVVATPVLVCGAGQLLVLLAVSRLDARVETTLFLLLMGAASALYVAALVLVARGRATSGRELAACLVLGVVWRVALIGGAPLASDDVYRYVWDGRVQQYGHNPYVSTPNDPALATLHTDVTRRIDPTSAELPTIYPPAAQLFFRAVTTVHESVTAIAVAVVLCDLLTALVLWRWLVSMGKDPWWVLIYAWHPLVAVEGAGAGHVDLVGTLLVVSAAYALHARRGLIASVALGVAFSVKFLPLVLVPLFWRRVTLGEALSAVGIVALLYLLFVDSDLLFPVGSLVTYAAQWRFNGPLFAWLESTAGLGVSVVLTVGSGLAVAAVARARLPRDAPEAWAWPMAATLVLMPAIYPWYLVWLIPFLTSSRTWPLMVWSLSVLLTYVVWITESSGGGWVLPPWVEPVEYALLAASVVLAWLLFRPGRMGSFAAKAASN